MKCRNVIFNFYENLMIFLILKKWSNIPFSYLFFMYVQNFKPKIK
jgi:hypothetical protein